MSVIKRLFIDIETSPNIGMFWSPGNKISVPAENILVERRIICICYKWEGESTVHHLTWDKNQCDKAMLKAISKVLNKADDTVGHNGDRYDLAFITGRLAAHDLDPLGPVSSTDTLKLSRRAFYINSHRLDYLGKYFDLGRKISTGGFSLWKRVLIDKCPKAMDDMVKYCKQDVILLEKVYKRIIKYVAAPKHYGRAMTGDAYSCRICGSSAVVKYGTFIGSSGVVSQKYKCKGCNHIGKQTMSKEV